MALAAKMGGGGTPSQRVLQQGYAETYWLASHILLSGRAKGARLTCRREYNTCTDCLAATVLLMIIRTPTTTARVARQRHFRGRQAGCVFAPRRSVCWQWQACDAPRASEAVEGGSSFAHTVLTSRLMWRGWCVLRGLWCAQRATIRDRPGQESPRDPVLLFGN